MSSENQTKKDDSGETKGLEREKLLEALKEIILEFVDCEEYAAKLQVSDNYAASGELKGRLLKLIYKTQKFRKFVSKIRFEIRDKRRLPKSDDSVSLRENDTE